MHFPIVRISRSGALALLGTAAVLSSMPGGNAHAQGAPPVNVGPLPVPTFPRADATDPLFAAHVDDADAPCRPVDPSPRKQYAPRYTEIPAFSRKGVLAVQGVVNNCVEVEFFIDSGAAHVFLPASIASQLRRRGALPAFNRLGAESYSMADGRAVLMDIYRLEALTIGDLTVRDVTAAIGSGEGPALLGMSFLKRFFTWSVNNHRKLLVLNSGTLPNQPF